MSTPEGPKRGWRLVDDRGTPRPSIDVSSLRSDPRFVDPVFGLMVSRAVGLREALPFRSLLLQSCIGVGITVPLFVGCLLFGRALGGVGPFSLIIAVVVGSVLTSAIMGRLNRVERTRSMKESMSALLAEGVCAGCGYNLAGLKAEADGCRVCPECGAAWLNSAIRREHAFRDSAGGDELVNLGATVAVKMAGGMMGRRGVLKGRGLGGLHNRLKRRDHRGVPRPMLKADLNWVRSLPVSESAAAPANGPVNANALPRERLLACRAALRSAARGYCWLLTCIIAAVWALLAGMISFSSVGSAPWALVGVLAGISAIFIAATWSSRPLPWYGIFRRIMLERRLCPGCGWGLPTPNSHHPFPPSSALTPAEPSPSTPPTCPPSPTSPPTTNGKPDGDGCTVCAECGAAWRLKEHTRETTVLVHG